jgi:hypothetical protein
MQEIRGDAVQPGKRALAQRLEATALLECDPEDLGGEVIRPAGPDPSLQVAVDHGEMALEDLPEELRRCRDLAMIGASGNPSIRSLMAASVI